MRNPWAWVLSALFSTANGFVRLGVEGLLIVLPFGLMLTAGGLYWTLPTYRNRKLRPSPAYISEGMLFAAYPGWWHKNGSGAARTWGPDQRFPHEWLRLGSPLEGVRIAALWYGEVGRLRRAPAPATAKDPARIAAGLHQVDLVIWGQPYSICKCTSGEVQLAALVVAILRQGAPAAA